ncbi:membrane protein [Microbacterium faecale]|uniref:Membrane protein n=1 Tax=Microbacterium faecale TaxID=1804630 RepID=A0A916Y5R8_9MICO|nr:membrane protein [Microbacterium faecale]
MAAILLIIGLGAILLAAIVPALSALLLAIVIGAIAGNLRIVPASTVSSISWAAKKYLRLGIVLLRFKLSIVSLGTIGLRGVAVLLITVAVTFVGTIAIGRLMHVPRVTRMLVATGFSICGASAVAAMSSIVDPRGKHEEDTAQAIALVTIFGTIAMFALPLLTGPLGLSDLQAGVWAGASIHEVAQVVAAGGMISTAALALATVAKLGRVVLLAPLIMLINIIEHRTSDNQTSGKRPPLLPLFVAGFLVAVGIRTFVPLSAEVLGVLEFGANLLLAAAMLGLGFSVDVRKLIATGWRPLALGAISTILAAAVALASILLLGL